MIRGVKLEYASSEAIVDELASYHRDTGWAIREADTDEDIAGVDKYFTVPLGEGRSAEYGIDVKSEGAFNTGVREGRYTLLPGYGNRFAIKFVNGKEVLVVDAEAEENGGGLAPGGVVRIRRNRVMEPFKIEAWRLKDPHKFAQEVMTVVSSRTATLPAHGGSQ